MSISIFLLIIFIWFILFIILKFVKRKYSPPDDERLSIPDDDKLSIFNVLATFGMFMLLAVLIIMITLPESEKSNSEIVSQKQEQKNDDLNPPPTPYSSVVPSLQYAILSAGYMCGSVDLGSVFPFSWAELQGRRGYHVTCDRFQYGYEVEDVGGRTVVTVK